MNKIALFGTSADPPTVGHQTILQWLSKHYDYVIVWASDNPFKQDQTPLQYRSQMLQLTITDLGLNNISLHQELSDRYTLITVNKAREKWGENIEFSLVIGSDILPQINHWYRIKELLRQVKVIIIPRLGYQIQKTDLKDLAQLGGEYAISTLNPPQVSSSNYRLEKDQSLIIPLVRNYIKRRKLYDVVTKVISND